VKYLDINKLKPLENNPFKSKGDKQVEAIGKSIKSFEKMMSIRKIVIDENNEILGGNKRYFALKKLGYKEIPDDWIDKRDDLTPEEKKEFIVKDNAHWGSEWDFEMLSDWEIEPVYCQVIINRMKQLNPDIEIKCLNREFNPIQ
jgi:ParB-like chromosome segregation protein Spo0J